MWEFLLIKLCLLMTLSLGTILIVLYPIIKKTNKIISYISLSIGSFVIITLIYWLINLPGILDLLRNGFK